MGGEVWVDSREGEGTQFHFTMVLNSAEEKPIDCPVPTFVQDLPPEGRRCLIVEHSPIIRDLLRRDVGVIGLQGAAVSNITEARASIQSNGYAVIIVDGSLSECEAFVREIAENARKTRMVVTSVLGTVAEVDGPNVVTTLVKPIRRWRLFKALERALSQLPIVTMSDADIVSLKDMHPQALANLAFRHPLRILVCPRLEYIDRSLPKTILSIPRLLCNI
jgi:CheY-like chemotaxis protein